MLRSLPKANKRSSSSLSMCVPRGESAMGFSFLFLPQTPRVTFVPPRGILQVQAIHTTQKTTECVDTYEEPPIDL